MASAWIFVMKKMLKKGKNEFVKGTIIANQYHFLK